MTWLTEPDEDWDPPEDSPEHEPKGRLKLLALIFAGWLAVSLLVLIGLLVFGGHSSSGNKSGSKQSPVAPGTAATSGSPTENLPDGWVREAGDDQTNCAAHSYGQVQAFFVKTPCSSVHRVLATTNQGGRTVVIASNVVTFDTPAQAKKYLTLVNSDGTGNISDLLREGVGYPGGPSKLPAAAFASRQDGGRVWVAEAGYTSGTSNPDDAALKTIATEGIAAN
ncbi:MAG: hypothetical protein M3Y42_07330 [Actinomycetota bacterium]|nr:hypothetical protein [Actinomycetota bacterium]MDQ2956759.1 hypothetical protein [Actinomycetota bacterium]